MEQRHSGLGIASFVLALIAGALLLLLVGVAALLAAATPGGIDEDSPAVVVLGLMIFGGLFVAVVALGLGIAGLFQPRRAKVFAVLGTVFSALAIAGVGAVMTLGILVG